MRSLPLRGDGLGDELIFGDDFVLGFLLTGAQTLCPTLRYSNKPTPCLEGS